MLLIWMKCSNYEVIVNGKIFSYLYDPPSVGPAWGGRYEYSPKIILHGPTIFPSLLCSCLGWSHATLPVGARNITGLVTAWATVKETTYFLKCGRTHIKALLNCHWTNYHRKMFMLMCFLKYTEWFTMMIFSTTHCYNAGAMLQHCVVLKIVAANHLM